MGRILSRALLGETLRTFAAAFVAFSFIFQVAALYELLNHGASGRQVAIVAPYVIVYTLPFLLPVALLVGASLAYGRLAADNEIVPVTSGGLPATTLARPAIFLGLLFSFALYGLSGSLIPYGWLKKKDMTRDFIEDLSDLGEGENKSISSGDSYAFFFRAYSGSAVEGVEIVYAPLGTGGDAMLISGADAVSPDERPVEIVARRGLLVRDDLSDALRFELWDATLTQFEAPKSTTATPSPRPSRGLEEMPPRGSPNQASVGHLVVSIPIQRRLKDRTEYRSTAYLRLLIERFASYLAFTDHPEAQGRAALDRSLSLAATLAAPGAGPGGAGLALAGLAAASPHTSTVNANTSTAGRIRELGRWAESYLVSRRALSTGPFLFTVIGALVPLRLQHNNRLLPFIVALALVALTFFLPYLSARGAIEQVGGAPPGLYWLGPSLTAGVAVLLWLDVRRR